MKNLIKVVEVEDIDSVRCPFCGEAQFKSNGEECDLADLTPCEHNLFIATDDGFEHRSDAFNENMKLSDASDEEVDDLANETDAGWDGLTNMVSIPGSIKFSSYVPAPSFYGVYMGFAPKSGE